MVASGCRVARRFQFALIAAAMAFSIQSASIGAEPQATTGRTARATASRVDKPFFVLNMAGVNRLLSDVDFVSKSLERPAWAGSVRGLLALTGELKGIDRTRPAGLMAFVNPGEAPEPIAVGYLPITSLKLLRETLNQISAFQLSAAADSQGLYSLKSPDAAFSVKVQHGYALIARQPISLNRTIADPAKRFAALTRDYDLAVRINLSTVPRGMNTMILDYLRAAVADKSARRRGESKEQHRLRDALSALTLESLAQVARDGEQLTLGWNISEQQKLAGFDVRFTAKPSTATARRIATMNSTRGSLAADNKSAAPASFSASWKVAPAERRVLARMLDVTEYRLRSAGGQNSAAAKQLVGALPRIRKTIDAAHINAIVSLLGASRSEYLLAVAVRTAGGPPLDGAVSSLLTGLRRESCITDLKIHAVKAGGVHWNHFRATGVNGYVAGVLRSQSPPIIAGVEQQTLWLATGTQSGPDALQKRFAQLKPGKSAANANTPLMSLSLQMSKILPILIRNPKPESIEAKAMRSFREDDGNLVVRLNSEARTLSLRSRFGMGYLRLLSEMLSR